MLDMDLAKIYEVETRALKQAVRRNIDRFPYDFMFELTEEEMKNLVSQNVIPTLNHLGGAKPFAFTEQGIAMLSNVLKSKKAIQMNFSVMRAFVMMRQFALTYHELSEKLLEFEKQYTLLRCVPSLKLRRKRKLRESKTKSLMTSNKY